MASFERRCWRKAVKSRPGEVLSNRALEDRFLHETPLQATLQERRLKWTGHVLRMDEDRLPKQLLLAGPVAGRKRPTGGVRKTWKRRVAEDTECHLKPYSWTKTKWLKEWTAVCADTAQNRSMWRGVTRDIFGASVGRLRP